MSYKIDVPFGDVVRSWMRYHRVTTEELAERMGLARVTVSLMINGRNNAAGVKTNVDPSISRIVEFANVAGVNPADIVRLMTGEIPLTAKFWRQVALEDVMDKLAAVHPDLDRDELLQAVSKIDEDFGE